MFFTVPPKVKGLKFIKIWAAHWNTKNKPNLEQLCLENCKGLNNVDPSIGGLKKLTWLNLGGCQNLRSLPSIESLDSIEVPNLNETAIEEPPSSIDHLTGLAELSMRECKNLRSLPTSIWRLKSLQELYLDGCSNLEALPEIMEDVKNVDDLGLAKMATKEFTFSIQHLRVLYLSSCSKLERFYFLKDLFSLVTLDLSNQDLTNGAIPSDLWCLSSLEYLNISGNNICHIPVAITQLCKLKKFNISHCKMLQEIPKLPSSLKRIDAHDCTGLKTLSSSSSLLWYSFLQWFQSTRLRVCNIFDIGMNLDFFCTHKIYMLPWIVQDLALHANERGMGIKIPRSRGIPGWVMPQEIGNEVRIELPVNWYQDNDFLGFSCFCLYQPEKILFLNCNLKLGSDSCEEVDCVRFISSCQCCRINGSVSDQVWVQ